MKPNDEDAPLPLESRPFRVLVISGSQRRQYNCPGVDSKSRALMLRMADRLPQEWEVDLEDLGNVYGRERIQPCNDRWADTKLKWRDTRMRVGIPPEGSSPAEQQRLGLNRDVTLTPGRSESTRNPE